MVKKVQRVRVADRELLRRAHGYAHGYAHRHGGLAWPFAGPARLPRGVRKLSLAP